MANNFQLITKYLTKALDTVFATESKTAILERGDKYIDLDFKEAGYVKIGNILMDGLSDYYRANSNAGGGNRTDFNGAGHNDGYAVGSASFGWEIVKLRYDRGKQFQVDEMDNEETAGLIIGNLLAEFLRTKVVPECDAIRFATIAGKANSFLGNKVSEAPVTTKGDASEITHLFNKGFEWLAEHEVPEEEQVIFVSPKVWTTIANTEEIYKTLTQSDYTSERGATFHLSAYAGRPIVVVPSDRFYDDVSVGDAGYAPTASSHVLNYIIASKKAIIPVVKLNKGKVFSPDSVQDFDGYKINFRIYHDCIVPKNKVLGCYVSVSSDAAIAKASRLDVALTATATKGNYRLDGAYTTPGGMLGTVIHKADAAFALGATDNSSASIAEGGTFAATGATEYFALKNSANVIIATGKADGLTKA